MLVKAVLIFLVVMVIIAWIGRLLLPGRKRDPAACPACRRPRIGRGPCSCGRT